MSTENSKMVEEEKSDQDKLFYSVDNVTSELLALVSSFSDEELNQIPFEGSWTAAQVGDQNPSDEDV